MLLPLLLVPGPRFGTQVGGIGISAGRGGSGGGSGSGGGGGGPITDGIDVLLRLSAAVSAIASAAALSSWGGIHQLS
jgi:hypothetical protein